MGWTIADNQGICTNVCIHMILLEEGHKPSIEEQRRLNPIMKELVMKEIVMWLDAGIIYPISNSSWVSPIQYMPNKGELIVVASQNNEPIPTRKVTHSRVCMDYKQLNNTTRKDQFPQSFIDQILNRLLGQEYYYFLDGYSGYT